MSDLSPKCKASRTSRRPKVLELARAGVSYWLGTDASRETIALCGHGLLVVTDAASQAGDRGNEARLRHPRLVSAGLGRHVADLIDLALLCRVIEPWSIHVSRRVLKCPRILAEQPLNVGIAVCD